MPYKYVEGMEKPLPDYSKRHAQRTATTVKVLKGTLVVNQVPKEN